MARDPERELKLVTRLLEPSCVDEEWYSRYRELANYVGEHLADRMLRKAREKRDIAAAMMAKAEQRPAKPAPGNGYDKQDAPLIEEMHRLMVERKAKSSHAAARMVAGDGSEVAGVSDLNSKVLRLVDGHRETYGE